MGAGPPGEYGGAPPDEDFEPDACAFEDPSDVTSMWRPSGQYWRGDACRGRYDHGRHLGGASRDFDRLAGIACSVRLVAGLEQSRTCEQTEVGHHNKPMWYAS